MGISKKDYARRKQALQAEIAKLEARLRVTLPRDQAPLLEELSRLRKKLEEA
jgi:hypothetical protein